MSYKFMIPGRPLKWADTSGLKYREFDIYPITVSGAPYGDASPNPYGLSSSAWTTGVSGSDTTIDRSITGSQRTFVYRGYFKPDQTSASWQFRTRSNDGSWLWIDNDATGSTTELNVNNAIVKNGGQHNEVTVTSANITLSQSSDALPEDEKLYYAITLIGGNDPGGGSLRLEFRRDGGSWQKDGTGFYYHDSNWSDGFDSLS